MGEKRSNREKNQPELLKKKKRIVSRVDDETTRILAEAGSQSRQDQ